MSRAGKVLHLYVEVRSVPEEDGKLPGDDGSAQLMLQCPDVLPQSQRSSSRSSPGPDLSPVSQHQSSKSSSRHSVSFQLQNPDATGSPTQVQRQDVVCDSFGHLLQVLAPETVYSGQHGSLAPTCSSETDPYRRRAPVSPSSTSSGRLTAPSPPTSHHGSYEVPGLEAEEGKTSVVTYGYIQKSSVHGTGGRRASMGQSDLDQGQPLPAHVQKRLSDPLWYNGQVGQADPYPSHPYPPQSRSPRSWSYMQKKTLDSVARDATFRALEEFGSPELRRRFAGHNSVNCSPTLPGHHQSPRCRSWAGSPVLPRSTLTLPARAHLLELDRGICRSSVNGLPRSPASDHLCAHTGYSSHSLAPTSVLRCHGLTQNQQRPRTLDDSLRLSNRFHPPLPAGRPTDIQHDVQPGVCPRTGQATENRIDYNANANSSVWSRTQYSPSRCSSRSSDAPSPTDAEGAWKLAVEASKMSTAFADRRTPSPSENLKTGGPVLTEPQPCAALHGHRSPDGHRWKTDQAKPQTRPGRISPVSSPASPARSHHATSFQSPVLDPRQQDWSTLHHHQPPQYIGEHKLRGMELRRYDHLFDRSPSNSPTLSSQTTDLPVSWTSRHQGWREAAPVQHGGQHSSKEEYHWITSRGDEGMKTSVQGHQAPVITVSKDQTEEVPDHSGATGTSSRSSSGVTGSMGDRNEGLSPETWSQSSHDTADTSSGMQVGWGGRG